jgi:hypothetical protein
MISEAPRLEIGNLMVRLDNASKRGILTLRFPPKFMKFPVGCLMSVLLFSAAAFAEQKVADDAPPDAAALDVQMASLAKIREQKKTQYFLQTRDEIERAVSSSGAAGNYVLDCMRRVRFEGHKGGNVEFSDWKKKNIGLYSDHDFERAANLHLRYLALTLKRATLESVKPVMQEVWEYLDLLSKSQDLIVGNLRNPEQVKISVYDEKSHEVSGEIVGQINDIRLANAQNTRGFVEELLNGSVTGGLAAQALKLNQLLQGIPDWEMVPGNFSGILERDIRTELRKEKDPRLVATWDYEIAYLGGLAKLKKDEQVEKEFETETYPRLRWKQAKDVELIGMPNRALTMRIAVAKQFPQHPDFDQWTAEISTELQKRKEALLAAKSAGKDALAPNATGESAPAAPASSPAAAPQPN